LLKQAGRYRAMSWMGWKQAHSALEAKHCASYRSAIWAIALLAVQLLLVGQVFADEKPPRGGRAARAADYEPSKTPEYWQFRALVENPGNDAASVTRRRRFLQGSGIVGDGLSESIVRKGSVAYARQRWRELSEARKGAATLDDMGQLRNAWNKLSSLERQHRFESIELVGLDEAEIAPPTRVSTNALESIAERPANNLEAQVVVLRALLIGGDADFYTRLVRYIAEFYVEDQSTFAGGGVLSPWVWLAQSPDAPAKEALVDASCRDRELAQRGSLLFAVLRARMEGRYGLITDDDVCRVLKCAPDDAIQRTLERFQMAGDWLTNCAKALLVADDDIGDGAQSAIVSVLGRDPEIFQLVFRSENSKSVWRQAALRAYLQPGLRPPPSLNLEEYLNDANYPEIEHELVVDLLARQARSLNNDRSGAAKKVLNRAAQDHQSPSLRLKAQRAVAELARWEEMKSQSRAVDRLRGEEELQRMEELLERDRLGEIDLGQNAREFWRFGVPFSYLVKKDQALKPILAAVDQHFQQHETLPRLLADLHMEIKDDEVPEEFWGELLYLPSSNAYCNGERTDIILIMTTEAIDLPPSNYPLSGPVVLLGMASGDVFGADYSTFPDRWKRSNEARKAAGDAPIDDSVLENAGLSARLQRDE